MNEDLARYERADFEEPNPFEPNQDDIDFVEDYNNFEDHIDEDMNRRDLHAFKNQILFNVQELGAVKIYHNNEIFLKGEHCEDSLKDLNKAVRKDGLDDPITKLQLGEWNVLNDQLIPILITQP